MNISEQVQNFSDSLLKLTVKDLKKVYQELNEGYSDYVNTLAINILIETIILKRDKRFNYYNDLIKKIKNRDEIKEL